MDPLNKWMVGLDLTSIDHSVIKYTKLLHDILKPQRIEFVHMASWLPDAVHVHLPDQMKAPGYEELLAEVEKEVLQYFSKDDPISCEVMEGSVQFDLWRDTYLKEVDLFIVGSKEKHQGRGLFPKKFVRKSFCSVLFVPEEIPTELSRIWVPVDFSEASGDALNFALQLTQQLESSPEVCVQHVYEMPHAYYYEGFPRDEIMRAVREVAESQFEEFNTTYNQYRLPVTSIFTPLITSYASDHIKNEAETQQASLILIAAGGRSRFSKFFLGSETEKLVQLEKKVPLLVLKERKDYVGLWDLINP